MISGAPIPILMYHSVGRPLPGAKSPLFSVPPRVFADHIEKLSRAGFRSVTLDDVRAHVAGEKGLPPKSVAITFDDGYLDNWTYAVPILKKYGFRGAVFVTTDFVDSRDIVRPTLAEAGFREIDSDRVEVRGFMSWRELEKASAEKILAVESHGRTHTFYPTSPDIVDFHHPGDSHAWLDWNAYPEDKPFYLERAGESRVPWGTPVYAHGRSLRIRRYFPDPRESEEAAEFARSKGGEAFFRLPGWRETLGAHVQRVRKGRPAKDRLETPEERHARYDDELRGAKKRIEQSIGRSPGFFVFPGGGYTEESFELALSIYKAVALRSPENERIRNRPGEDPRWFSRRGTQVLSAGGRSTHTGGAYLVEFLREYQGSAFARRRRQAMKVFYLAGLRVGLRGV
jgi:peptidoglycan/xylan/chitin deacetylase (PgdA/CDA1 family)